MSVPYLRLKKTRKPLFLQLETTKALKKLIEKKLSNFSNFFLNFPVSYIVPKNVKGGPLGFFEHPFCCKILKIDGGTIRKFREKNQKFEQSHSAEKKGKSYNVKKVDPSALEWLFISR